MISSQFLFEVKASDINVLMSPFDFACDNFVLFSPVNSEVVSMSVNLSSKCEESFPSNTVISHSNELSRDVFFRALHRVFVYLLSTSPMGSAGMFAHSVIAN